MLSESVLVYSVEIPTRCSFITEFIIPSFIEGSTVFVASGLYAHVVTGRCLGNGRSPHGRINQRLQIQFRAPDDERRAARKVLSLQ